VLPHGRQVFSTTRGFRSGSRHSKARHEGARRPSRGRQSSRPRKSDLTRAPPTPSLGNKRMHNEQVVILVIEDDESIALGLKMNLEAEGYAVMLETDGESGLERALKDSADLLILDVMLPRQNGFEVLRRFRESGASTPV